MENENAFPPKTDRTQNSDSHELGLLSFRPIKVISGWRLCYSSAHQERDTNLLMALIFFWWVISLPKGRTKIHIYLLDFCSAGLFRGSPYRFLILIDRNRRRGGSSLLVGLPHKQGLAPKWEMVAARSIIDCGISCRWSVCCCSSRPAHSGLRYHNNCLEFFSKSLKMHLKLFRYPS